MSQLGTLEIEVREERREERREVEGQCGPESKGKLHEGGLDLRFVPVLGTSTGDNSSIFVPGC